MSVSTQFENLGDALIHREVIRLASNHGDVLVDWSRCPKDFRDTLALTGLSRVRTIESRARFQSALLTSRLRNRRTILLAKPGAYIRGRGVGPMKAKAILAYYGFLNALGVEQMKFGVSYEKLTQNHLDFLVAKSRTYAKHYVRGQSSLDYARKSGMTIDGVLPDLAFNLFETEPTQPRKVQYPLRVAFSFRDGQYDGQTEDLVAFVRTTLKTIGSENVASVRLVSQVSWDAKTMELIADRLKQDGWPTIELFDVHKSLKDARHVYSESDILFSNRLHSLLICATVTPHIIAAIDRTYNEKLADLFDTNGWSSYVVDIGNTDQEIIKRRLEHAIEVPIEGGLIKDELVKGFADAISL